MSARDDQSKVLTRYHEIRLVRKFEQIVRLTIARGAWTVQGLAVATSGLASIATVHIPIRKL